MTRKIILFGGIALFAVLLAATYSISILFDDAVMHMKAGRYDTAKPELEKLAQLGNSKAQHLLGEMHAYGWGVPRNRDEAIKWFRRAAYRAEGLKDSAAYSAYYVGQNYLQGLGVQSDAAEAEKWFQLAKEGGYTDPEKSKRP